LNTSIRGKLSRSIAITVDDYNTYDKERMKAILLIMQCYNKRLKLVGFEATVILANKKEIQVWEIFY
jgi:hypothetical protein